MTPPQHTPAQMAMANQTPPHAWVARTLLAGLLGLTAAALVACSSNGKLIPVANSGPLQSDFEAVEQASEAGDGSCTATEAAILKTEQDYSALPASVDSGLRTNIHQGIANLRSRALALCAQPLVQATVTTPKTTTTRTTPTTIPTTTATTTTPTTIPTTTTPTSTATTPSTPSPGGGTPAPGVGETPTGAGSGQGGGTGAGEGDGHGVGNGHGEGNGHGAGDGAGVGQEATK
jgi:hypothetical protein